jgi:hypothetical protein
MKRANRIRLPFQSIEFAHSGAIGLRRILHVMSEKTRMDRRLLSINIAMFAGNPVNSTQSPEIVNQTDASGQKVSVFSRVSVER